MWSKMFTAPSARSVPARRLLLAQNTLAFILAAAVGCSTTGPVTVRGDRFKFNEAGAESTKEQILLNIVRLRYGEPIYFVEIGSMLSHYEIGAGGQLSAYHNSMEVWDSPTLRALYNMRGEPPQDRRTWEANLHYSDSPTISYTPLTGEEFANRVMAPIPPTTIVFLSQSGWGIDRLLECCVQRINDVANREIRDLPESQAPPTGQFRRLAELLKQAQAAGYLRLGVETEAGQNATYLYVSPVPSEWQQDQSEVNALLGLPPQPIQKIRLTASAVRTAPDEVAMQTRSLLACMYALAQQVPLPSEHPCDRPNASPPSSEEQESAPQWLRIQHSRLPQVDPFVQVSYHGYWFYIDESDYPSKRTFSLLTYLFSLQSSGKGQTGPLLTVPAGK